MDNDTREEHNTSTQVPTHANDTVEHQVTGEAETTQQGMQTQASTDSDGAATTELPASSTTDTQSNTSYNRESSSVDRNNRYARPSEGGQQSSFRKEGGGYRPHRFNDKRNEFAKDRDTRFKKFRKYDKIATKKLDIDYKKPHILKEFITEEGKILSTSFTGTSSKNQRRLIREIKRARHIGLLPSA